MWEVVNQKVLVGSAAAHGGKPPAYRAPVEEKKRLRLLQDFFIASALMIELMHIISRDAPCYYLTSVAKNRLQVFRSDAIKLITCAALDEARRSGKFALYAYVIMPDHLHVITDSVLTIARTLQFINGIISRRIIGYLKDNGHSTSLNKLRHAKGPRGYSHSLWDHHPDARLLLSEKMLMHRVHYTHQNPVRAGLVEQPADYRWSSVRCWTGNILDDEPLIMDIDKIKWRGGGRAS